MHLAFLPAAFWPVILPKLWFHVCVCVCVNDKAIAKKKVVSEWVLMYLWAVWWRRSAVDNNVVLLAWIVRMEKPWSAFQQNYKQVVECDIQQQNSHISSIAKGFVYFSIEIDEWALSFKLHSDFLSSESQSSHEIGLDVKNENTTVNVFAWRTFNCEWEKQCSSSCDRSWTCCPEQRRNNTIIWERHREQLTRPNK